jgi:hypothetical protein
MADLPEKQRATWRVEAAASYDTRETYRDRPVRHYCDVGAVFLDRAAVALCAGNHPSAYILVAAARRKAAGRELKASGGKGLGTANARQRVNFGRALRCALQLGGAAALVLARH